MKPQPSERGVNTSEHATKTSAAVDARWMGIVSLILFTLPETLQMFSSQLSMDQPGIARVLAVVIATVFALRAALVERGYIDSRTQIKTAKESEAQK